MEKSNKSDNNRKNNFSGTNCVANLSRKNLLQTNLLSTLPPQCSFELEAVKKAFQEAVSRDKMTHIRIFYWTIQVWDEEMHLGKHKHKTK